MKERPILFSGAMVRAILEGRKTQTRRIAKEVPAEAHEAVEGSRGVHKTYLCDEGGRSVMEVHPDGSWHRFPGMSHAASGASRYGAPGDRLWVRETWAATDDEYGCPVMLYGADRKALVVGADGSGNFIIPNSICGNVPEPERWCPSIFMRRWSSRITLEIESVRVERLQAISEEDARAEGVERSGDQWRCYDCGGTKATARGAFESLWRSINGAETWDANVWVWVVSFKRVESAAAREAA